AIERYTNEVNRLYGVMERRLADRDYLAGEYSIADMACIGWMQSWERMGQNIDDFPALRRWFDRMNARPAVQAGLAVGTDVRKPDLTTDEQARKVLFGQRAR